MSFFVVQFMIFSCRNCFRKEIFQYCWQFGESDLCKYVDGEVDVPGAFVEFGGIGTQTEPKQTIFATSRYITNVQMRRIARPEDKQ